MQEMHHLNSQSVSLYKIVEILNKVKNPHGSVSSFLIVTSLSKSQGIASVVSNSLLELSNKIKSDFEEEHVTSFSHLQSLLSDVKSVKTDTLLCVKAQVKHYNEMPSKEKTQCSKPN